MFNQSEQRCCIFSQSHSGSKAREAFPPLPPCYMFLHICQCLNVFLRSLKCLSSQFWLFLYIRFDALTISSIANWFKLYNNRWKPTLIRQMENFGQGLTHVTTVIVHKGGVGGEPWAVSWSTSELGWCDTLDLPRFQSLSSVPKNETRSKYLKISKIELKSLGHD